MDYIEVSFEINPVSSEYREIIAALLGEIDFESFADTKQGLQAYIQLPLFNEDTMNETLSPIKSLFENFNFSITTIKEQNWNAEWEKNFDPIHIGSMCRIRAPFHSSEGNFTYDLIIEPKMSFGTGHHATTSLMLQLMFEVDFSHKNVLDMGCGTGVLAILASLKHAEKIVAIDIDAWAFENTIENAERNMVNNIIAKQGDAKLLENEKFDIILANINRNILISDMHIYAASLKKEGLLLLSGFYTQDLPLILEKAELQGLKYISQLEQDNWMAVKLQNTAN
jgi:ribosomal protein L11 methyltransferase